MRKINWQPDRYKVLSIFLALMLWLYVSNEQRNPLAEREIYVALEVAGLTEEHLIIGGLPENVRIRIQGNSTRLASLSPSDFRAQLILPTDKTGLVTVPVLVNYPSGINTQVYPNEVNVTIDTITEKTLPIVISLQGSAAPGYLAQAPQYQPTETVAKGPSQELNDLKQINLVVNIEAISKGLEETLTINAGSSRITLSPDTVRVVVPVIQADAAKSVPVKPQLSGEPAEGYQLVRVVADPETIQISGQAEIIGDIGELLTSEVSIQGLTKDLTTEAALLPIPGLPEVEANRIKVSVFIERVESPPQAPPEQEEEENHTEM